MVKCTFEEPSSYECFVASTTDINLIQSLQGKVGTNSWVIGLLWNGTVDNICGVTERTWHYETFTAFEPVSIEECQTTVYLVEQYPDIWLNRSSNSCIWATLINICPDITCSFGFEVT